MTILAADIGGTHARFGILEDGRTPSLRFVASRTYDSSVFADATEAVRRYVEETSIRPQRAAIAVAGPVEDGFGIVTNLGWKADAAELADATGTSRVRVLNDFEALAYALPELGKDDYQELQQGRPDREGTVALLGAGTGLGQAFVVRCNGRWVAHPSEGGHGDFAATDDAQWRLRARLVSAHGHASWERVLSGGGIETIYASLVEDGPFVEDASTRVAMRSGVPSEVISTRALDRADPVCVAALELFLSAYGAKAGDVALGVRASGGVWIGGGIARGVAPLMRSGTFLDAFRSKGRLSSWMERVPVRVITRDDAGLLGAALASRRLPG